MRKLLTVTLALMLVLGLSGLALANSGWVDQNADTWCKEKVQQFGSGCQLYGALPGPGGVGGGTPDGSRPAHQRSVYDSCEVDIWQGGDSDTIGLYQDGSGYNYAYIGQSGGGNALYVYQSNYNGHCRVDVVQTGNDIYSTRQIAANGDCDLYVRQ